MKTLLLLRHAKSSKDDPSLADFDRPLNDRGEHDAKLIGSFISEKKIRPDLVMSSPAERAQRTTELVLTAASLRLKPGFDERIYEAGTRDLLEVLSEIKFDPDMVMLVGHNPGFEELFHALTNETIDLPTASLVSIQLAIHTWSKVRPKIGKVGWLVTPRELKR
jgi:phosphohistidine phosphatase